MPLHLKKPIVFFDLETTGISISADKIVEISMLKIKPDGSREVITQRINPGIPIPPESSKIHGIFDADVADKPYFHQVARQYQQFMEGCDLAGYNIIKFDVPMLVEEFLRVNIEFEIDSRNLVDAQKIFHLMEPRTLSAAYKFYCNKELINAHSAEADTLATFEILESQIERYMNVPLKDDKGKEWVPVTNDMTSLHNLTITNQIDFAGRMVRNEKGDPLFNFGKHKGKRVVDVLAQEPSYYDWMMGGDFPLDTKRRLTLIKLSMRA